MENASKALIIAGAILLAILLISLGIMIFNQAQGTVNNSGMSEAEITSFNNKFLKYEGKQKGSVVKSLINEAAAINNDGGRKVTVKVKGTVKVSGDTTTTSGVDNSATYNVTLVYGTGNGVVTSINCSTKNQSN